MCVAAGYHNKSTTQGTSSPYSLGKMCGLGILLDQGTIMGTTEGTTEKKLLIVCVYMYMY